MDYTKTFAPVAKMDSFMLVLAMFASKHWEVHHMDVKSTFLHRDLQEEIYMKQLEGYISDPTLGLQIKEIFVWFKTNPKSMVCKDGFLSSVAKLCEMQIKSKCVSTAT